MKLPMGTELFKLNTKNARHAILFLDPCSNFFSCNYQQLLLKRLTCPNHTLFVHGKLIKSVLIIEFSKLRATIQTVEKCYFSSPPKHKNL